MKGNILAVEAEGLVRPKEVSLEEVEKILKRDPQNVVVVPASWERSGATIFYWNEGFSLDILILGASPPRKVFDSLREALDYLRKVDYMGIEFYVDEAKLIYWS